MNQEISKKKNDFKEKVWNGKFTCEIKIEIAHNDG